MTIMTTYYDAIKENSDQYRKIIERAAESKKQKKLEPIHQYLEDKLGKVQIVTDLSIKSDREAKKLVNKVFKKHDNIFAIVSDPYTILVSQYGVSNTVFVCKELSNGFEYRLYKENKLEWWESVSDKVTVKDLVEVFGETDIDLGDDSVVATQEKEESNSFVKDLKAEQFDDATQSEIVIKQNLYRLFGSLIMIVAEVMGIEGKKSKLDESLPMVLTITILDQLYELIQLLYLIGKGNDPVTLSKFEVPLKIWFEDARVEWVSLLDGVKEDEGLEKLRVFLTKHSSILISVLRDKAVELKVEAKIQRDTEIMMEQAIKGGKELKEKIMKMPSSKPNPDKGTGPKRDA